MTSTSLPPNTQELRRFGLTTGAIVAVLFGLLLPGLFKHPLPLWPWLVALILGGWALALPNSLSPVYQAWMAVGHVLGWINSRIILSIMFYVLILPVGLILRLFGKDPMHRKFDKNASTYRIPSKNQPKNHLERPF